MTLREAIEKIICLVTDISIPACDNIRSDSDENSGENKTTKGIAIDIIRWGLMCFREKNSIEEVLFLNIAFEGFRRNKGMYSTF